MENFVVSARKYRPATFDSVVGQAHITNTLKNAIKTGHLAQAFLFCGPRGVGKTTCARILAKTINCTNRTENIEACNECESCTSFNQGASLNIMELDAASNNSVDDIRNLTDQVRYAPQSGKYKVYIIDEVHMLSTAAFNAFLKTLEEPPKHAIFILATTEKHKIIPTILSRCQIFDFNRIQIDDIASHLAYIAKSENVVADTDALHIIAQKADGALRDACSIFDQIVSFAGSNITYKAVIDNLNILDYDYYFKTTDAIIEENISATLLIFNEILDNGFDGHNFIGGMGSHFRDLLVSKDTETIQLLEVSNNIKEKYKEQASKCSLPFLIKGLSILNKADTQYKSAKNQRLLVELSLMHLCTVNSQKVEAEKKNDLNIASASSEKNTAGVSNTASGTNPSVASPQKTDVPKAHENPVKTTTAAAPITNGTTAKKPLIKTSMPSINPFATKEEGKDDNKNGAAGIAEEQAKAPFTQEQLERVWIQYAQLMKQKGKVQLEAALINKQPDLKENYRIEFTINNRAVEEMINENKTQFLEFLRKGLNNFSISVELKMIETEEKPGLYTATDKYRFLVEKNPNLNKLRQAFDLDIEH